MHYHQQEFLQVDLKIVDIIISEHVMINDDNSAALSCAVKIYGLSHRIGMC